MVVVPPDGGVGRGEQDGRQYPFNVGVTKSRVVIPAVPLWIEIIARGIRTAQSIKS
jgi:hypothetical protein